MLTKGESQSDHEMYLAQLFCFSSDPSLQTPVKKQDTGSDLTDNVVAHCKEEQDHIPIIKINSVCSMASTNPSPERQVTSDISM